MSRISLTFTQVLARIRDSDLSGITLPYSKRPEVNKQTTGAINKGLNVRSTTETNLDLQEDDLDEVVYPRVHETRRSPIAYASMSTLYPSPKESKPGQPTYRDWLQAAPVEDRMDAIYARLKGQSYTPSSTPAPYSQAVMTPPTPIPSSPDQDEDRLPRGRRTFAEYRREQDRLLCARLYEEEALERLAGAGPDDDVRFLQAMVEEARGEREDIESDMAIPYSLRSDTPEVKAHVSRRHRTFAEYREERDAYDLACAYEEESLARLAAAGPDDDLCYFKGMVEDARAEKEALEREMGRY